MHAKVILANPEKRLYAAHVAASRKIAVFELLEGAPLRIGDIIRATFTYTGEQEATLTGQDGCAVVIFVIKTGISPLSAHVCLQALEACVRDDEPP